MIGVMPVIREAWRTVRDVQNPAAPAVEPARSEPAATQAAPDASPAADDRNLLSRMQSLLASLRSTPADAAGEETQATMGDVIRSLQAYNAQLTDAETPGRTTPGPAALAIDS